jgi:hypothetical protein
VTRFLLVRDHYDKQKREKAGQTAISRTRPDNSSDDGEEKVRDLECFLIWSSVCICCLSTRLGAMVARGNQGRKDCWKEYQENCAIVMGTIEARNRLLLGSSNG